jgi:peptidoglycan/xylan/chitin deacetylase (PgdA/CDA1 family)
MKRSFRSGRALLCLITKVLVAQTALAGEQLIEGFRRGPTFAPKWGEAVLEHPAESGFSQLRITTKGLGEAVFVSNVRAYDPPIDLTARFIKVWIKIDDLRNVGGIEFRLSSDRFSSGFFAFEVAIYSDPEFNFLVADTWVPLTFSLGRARVVGKPDASAIDSIGVYLVDKGQLPLTFSWGAVLAVDQPDQGVVSITFDDGYDEHYDIAAGIMAEHGQRGTAYVIPNAVGRVGYMSIPQLAALQERFGWDVAAHHETAFTDFAPGELETVIMGLQQFLVRNGFDRGARHLAYPLGKQTLPGVRSLVRKHFGTARMASFGPETLPPADPHLLRVHNVLRSTSPEEIARAVRQARTHREWLILMFHYLVEEPETDLDYGISDFARAMQLIARENVKVSPMSEVWDAGWRRPALPAAHR